MALPTASPCTCMLVNSTVSSENTTVFTKWRGWKAGQMKPEEKGPQALIRDEELTHWFSWPGMSFLSSSPLSRKHLLILQITIDSPEI